MRWHHDLMTDPYVGPPRPRILALKLTAAEVEEITPLAGSIIAVNDLNTIHAEEHDLLVLTGAEHHTLSGVLPRRLVFANPPSKPSTEPGRIGVRNSLGYGGSRPLDAAHTQFRPAERLLVTDAAAALGLTSLVERSCRPLPNKTYRGLRQPTNPSRVVTPFIVENLRSPLFLAALLESDETTLDNDSVFWLPDMARANMKEWLAVALTHWRASDPGTFPESADWMNADTWSHPTAIRARQDLADHDAAQARVLAELDASRRGLEAAAIQAATASESWQALLTSDSDELVAAVADALSYLGFDVIDADALEEHKGKKREDLRITDGAWTALAEIKGYRGSAKSGALLQLSSAAITYTQTQQSAPDALWYIPNSNRDIDPNQREIPLANRQEDLDTFAETNTGCLIDTKDLFRVRQLVATDALSKDDAREALKSARGRFSAPEPG